MQKQARVNNNKSKNTSKKCAFAVFTRKYSRSSDCNGTNVMAAVNCANLKTEIPSKIVEIQFLINKIEINYFN